MRPRGLARKAGWTLAFTLALSLALPAPPAPAASTRDLYAADAYGSYSFVGQSATSGKSAFVVLGCQAKPGTVIQNSAESSEQSTPENAPAEGSTQTGSVSTSVSAVKNTSLSKSLSSAVTNGIHMLKGRITASRAKAVSATLKDATGMHTSPAGSILSDLVVDGNRFAVSPGPNTTVTLPQLGYAVLNEQASSTTGSVPFLVVSMIHVYVTQPNTLSLPVGSQMIVSRAYSALKPNIGGILGGFAYGSKLFQGESAQSGPSAEVFMPCLGTDGAVLRNQAAEVGQPSVFDLATINDKAKGTVSSTKASGELASTVQDVNLLNGLITADAVTADAHALKSGSAFSFNDGGSKLVNLVVAGQPVWSAVAPNTQIALPGIGTLWLHRVFTTSGSIEVRMIEIDVDQANPFGLQPGSVLQVAVAVALAAA
jgi:hypothetical protein